MRNATGRLSVRALKVLASNSRLRIAVLHQQALSKRSSSLSQSLSSVRMAVPADQCCIHRLTFDHTLYAVFYPLWTERRIGNSGTRQSQESIRTIFLNNNNLTILIWRFGAYAKRSAFAAASDGRWTSECCPVCPVCGRTAGVWATRVSPQCSRCCLWTFMDQPSKGCLSSDRPIFIWLISIW